MIQRGDIRWVDLGASVKSHPGKRRPVVAVQADSYNRSRLATVVCAVVTSNTKLAAMPGNVFLPAAATGLPRDSAVNVTALVTLDKTDLGPPAGHVPQALMELIDSGLRRLLHV